MFATLRAVFGEGRHRLKGHRTRDGILKPETVEMVDTATKQVHLLSDAAADHRDDGHYIALCGTDVTPAAMVEPGCGYCGPCSSSTAIPTRGTQ